MRKTLLLSTLTAAVLSTAVLAAPPVVNGAAISQSRIDAVVRMMEAQGQQSSPDLQAAARDQLITAEILRQAAVKKGLDKSPEYRAELENMQTMALASRLIKDFQRSNPVSDAQLRAEYDKIKSQFPEKKSYHARHILVPTEAEAKAVIDALRKGKAFDQLAKEKSIDPGSKNNGGDLGWSEASNFVAPFSEAMTKLAKGQVTSEPVKTEFGWHVIKLDDVRTEAAPPVEQIRPQLEQRIMSGRIEKFISDLKAKASIQ